MARAGEGVVGGRSHQHPHGAGLYMFVKYFGEALASLAGNNLLLVNNSYASVIMRCRKTKPRSLSLPPSHGDGLLK